MELPPHIDAAQVQRFLAEITPPASAICPQFGIDPETCVHDAAQASQFGTVAMGHNYWMLQGIGDAGYYQTMIAVPTGAAAGGGYVAQTVRYAKFSTPAAAVGAWCRSQAGG